MTTDDLSREIKEIRTILQVHTDMLAMLNGQGVLNTARLETILSTLRQVLTQHGIDPETSKKICEEIFATCVIVAQQENEKLRHSSELHRLPPSSGPEAARN